ncbi:MAG: protein kinase [Prevotella sp.]|nr:protein kinase [Prevotella sp.]MDD7335245.1 protein kinase [Prevotella sp.]
MMITDELSAFSGPLNRVTSQEQLYLNGSTCQTYIVRVYGKLHFKKQLKAEYKGMPQYVEAFRKEFEVGYRLNHPALPRYVALGDEDGYPYILEEYIDGDTLTDFLAANPCYFHSRPHADRLIDELLSAFSYLHHHQVLFLDLKPDNVMITSVERQLRLIDLGGCHTDCFVGTEETTKAFAPDRNANDAAQLHGKLWEPSFDIFLIGRLLQECRVPHIYNKVIAKCLKDDPQERYDSVDSMKKAIGALRRRLTFYKASMVVTVVACLAVVLSLLIPEEPKELRPQETTEKTETSQPLRAPERVLTAKEVKQTKMMEPKPSLQPNNGKAETMTAEARMTRELQQSMDFAYKKYIAPLPEDSLRDVDCRLKHFAMYAGYVNSEKERLKKKYTDLQPLTIDLRFAEIYSRTVVPISERYGSEE